MGSGRFYPMAAAVSKSACAAARSGLDRGARRADPGGRPHLHAMGIFTRTRRRPVEEQVVVVTGASAGVGRAIARAFGERRAKVGLIARTQEALDHCVEEIARVGGEALPLPLDVADAAAVESAADAVVKRFGRIDTWINDAMVSVFSRALEMTAGEYRRVTEVNYLGYVHGTLAALRRMKSQPDGGGIIQIGSALVYRSIPLQSAYCASKAAVRGFTDSVRSELLHDRVRIHLSLLELPAVNTPQFDVVRSRLPRRPQPVPPIYQPEVIARACLYVAEHPVRELWIAPSTIEAILGQRLVPGFADRYLARHGFDAQQTAEPASPGRRDDVDAPLPGDRGARGRFGGEARSFSAEVWLRTHPWLGAAAAALLVTGLAGWKARTA
jgi:NADP-dependent 3-hydroxy acid dehydrogenase YdfG